MSGTSPSNKNLLKSNVRGAQISGGFLKKTYGIPSGDVEFLLRNLHKALYTASLEATTQSSTVEHSLEEGVSPTSTSYGFL